MKGGFCFMLNNSLKPDKPFKTYDELIKLLRSRNVIINDDEYAKRCLSEYSYYDLINGYKYLYPMDNNEVFLNPVPFSELVFLHRFTLSWNNVILKYILVVEKSFKFKLAYLISEKHGVQTDIYDSTNTDSNDYLCRDYYKKNKYRNNILKRIKEEVRDNKSNLSVSHYLYHHNHLPCWILISAIPLGLAIKWYDILCENDKTEICNQFITSDTLSVEEKKEFLKIGLKILKEYRNKIAHGHKIFNNAITDVLPKKQVLELSNGMLTKRDYSNGLGRKDIFAVIIILSSLLEDDTRNLFIDELLLNIPHLDFVLSSGKSLFGMLELPDDFLERLEKIKSNDAQSGELKRR